MKHVGKCEAVNLQSLTINQISATFLDWCIISANLYSETGFSFLNVYANFLQFSKYMYKYSLNITLLLVKQVQTAVFSCCFSQSESFKIKISANTT